MNFEFLWLKIIEVKTFRAVYFEYRNIRINHILASIANITLAQIEFRLSECLSAWLINLHCLF